MLTTLSGKRIKRRIQTRIASASQEHDCLFCSRLFSSYDDDDDNNNNVAVDRHKLYREQLRELQEERESLFGFTNEERRAWTTTGSSFDDPKDFLSFEQAVELAREKQESQKNDPSNRTVFDDDDEIEHPHGSWTETTTTKNKELSHVSEDGSSVSMVDVGNKEVTRRMARARCHVVLPPEVVTALKPTSSNTAVAGDLIGPKGPVFETAKLAGIMAAKKTSDLIPLCHPLPLDKVDVQIRLRDDRVVVIECECRVTHKTGVEMEALTGASIAALTIYDMVKAVSHQVRIEKTVLISKSGGKRTVGPGDE